MMASEHKEKDEKHFSSHPFGQSPTNMSNQPLSNKYCIESPVFYPLYDFY